MALADDSSLGVDGTHPLQDPTGRCHQGIEVLRLAIDPPPDLLRWWQRSNTSTSADDHAASADARGDTADGDMVMVLATVVRGYKILASKRKTMRGKTARLVRDGLWCSGLLPIIYYEGQRPPLI